jgi:hypothetical protein
MWPTNKLHVGMFQSLCGRATWKLNKLGIGLHMKTINLNRQFTNSRTAWEYKRLPTATSYL